MHTLEQKKKFQEKDVRCKEQTIEKYRKCTAKAKLA